MTAILVSCRLPAAFLLGPMFAAGVMAVRERQVAIPATLFTIAQAVLGCMIATSLRFPLFIEIIRDWPVFAAGILSVVIISTALGWIMTRWQILPGTTALWGCSPGAAGVMVLLAEAFGADMRLVAFMQYVRVVVVAVVASIVPLFWTHAMHGAPGAVPWFAAVPPRSAVETLAVVGLGVFAARRRLMPAAGLLVPMILATGLQDIGVLSIALPRWVLVGAYVVIGWCVGMRFSRMIVGHALRALPAVLGSIALLVGSCALMAVGLVRWAGIDPLSAYLATSPGGADSVAVIAASVHVDLPFVMAMQVGRFIVVMLTAPVLARMLARLHERWPA